MAVGVLTAAKVVAGSVELGTADRVKMEEEVDELDATTLGSGGYKVYVPGFKTGRFEVQGLADIGGATTTQQLLQAIWGSQSVMQISSPGTNAGDPAFLGRGIIGGHTALDASVGQLARFTLPLQGDTAAVIGQLAVPLADRTTTANGSVLTLPAGPVAGQHLFAAVNATAMTGSAGPTLTVKIQSAPTVGFAGPVDRITFSSLNAVGWQWGSVDGAITDLYWRAIWTITGTSPHWTFAVALGVL